MSHNRSHNNRGRGRGGEPYRFKRGSLSRIIHGDNDVEQSSSHRSTENVSSTKCPSHLKGKDIGLWYR
jgi:hypothetical protein